MHRREKLTPLPWLAAISAKELRNLFNRSRVENEVPDQSAVFSLRSRRPRRRTRRAE